MIYIRPADSDDAAAIADIANQGIEDRASTFETAPRTVEDIAARLTDTARPPFLVAVDAAGAVMGWASIGSYRSRDCYRGIGEFSVYLDRAARGRGLGKQLLAALIEAARTAGYWKLLSRIFTFNMASRALCRSAGFREVGIYEKHAQLDGKWLDTVIVERLIPENMAPGFPITIYHNPGCGTARNTLAMIEAAGYAPIVVRYLETGWTRPLLEDLVARMGVRPRDILREKGTPAAELGLLDPAIGDEQLLDAMVAQPILVNRPIVATPKGVKLCRPSEVVLSLLERQPSSFVKEDGEIVVPAAATAPRCS